MLSLSAFSASSSPESSFLKVDHESAPLPSLYPAAAAATPPQVFRGRPGRDSIPVRRTRASTANISLAEG
eukprot:13898774-Heterocapsa_arctica.AAC.1